MRYEYDELDNISEIWYIKTVTGENGQTTTEEEQVYAYTYTKSGQLYRFDNLLTDTAVIYRYDPEGRLAYYTEPDTFTDENKLGSEIHYDDQNRLKPVSLLYSRKGFARRREQALPGTTTSFCMIESDLAFSRLLKRGW